MRLNIKNADAVKEALKTAQKGCHARTLDADEIFNIASQAIKSLKNLGLYRQDMEGAKVCFRNGYGRFPASYKSTPQSTHLTFEVTKSSIFLTSIFRDACDSKEHLFFINAEQFRDKFAKRKVELL